MRSIRSASLLGLLAMTAGFHVGRPAAEPRTADVGLEVIRYADLADRVRGLEGRVAVVDFWADYCAPCKRDFPHLVALHAKYATRGLSVVSVSLDDPADDAARERVKQFLAAKKATFVNFLLDEKPQAWQAKLKIDGPPCVFVFDRRGRLMKKYHDLVDYAEIERLVADLLK